MYLQYQGLITVNMDKIQNTIDKVITSIPNSISAITQAYGQFNIVPYSIGDLTIPLIGSMAIGITTGILRG